MVRPARGRDAGRLGKGPPRQSRMRPNGHQECSCSFLFSACWCLRSSSSSNSLSPATPQPGSSQVPHHPCRESSGLPSAYPSLLARPGGLGTRGRAGVRRLLRDPQKGSNGPWQQPPNWSPSLCPCPLRPLPRRRQRGAARM